jgi:hypothetical protein
MTGWKLQLKLRDGSVYMDAVVGATDITVTAYQGTFARTLPTHGGIGYKDANQYGSSFAVLDGGGAAACANLGSSIDIATQALRITNDSTNVGVVHTQGIVDGEDPPLPIVGGSLVFWAPDKSSFTCDASHTFATLKGATTPWSKLQDQIADFLPPETYVVLDGIRDWKITVFPQRLEIRPGRALALNFRMAEPKLVCDASQHWLKVDDDGRPQAFVVEWRAGGIAHIVQVPCGTCQLQLVKKGK